MPVSFFGSIRCSPDAPRMPGTGEITTAWTHENTTVLAPMPTPSHPITTAASAGSRRTTRHACRPRRAPAPSGAPGTRAARRAAPVRSFAALFLGLARCGPLHVAHLAGDGTGERAVRLQLRAEDDPRVAAFRLDVELAVLELAGDLHVGRVAAGERPRHLGALLLQDQAHRRVAVRPAFDVHRPRARHGRGRRDAQDAAGNERHRECELLHESLRR